MTAFSVKILSLSGESGIFAPTCNGKAETSEFKNFIYYGKCLHSYYSFYGGYNHGENHYPEDSDYFVQKETV